MDPFEPAKSQELAQIGELGRPTDRQALLLASLWGNRADLGFRAGTPARIAPQGAGKPPLHGDDSGLGPGHAAPSIEALVADDSARIWEHLAAGDPGQAIVVADNAGRELLADLLLIDHLLATYAATGALVLATHPFYCAPLPFHDLPTDFTEQYAAARLVLLKGDLNYRRLVGDTHQSASGTPWRTAGTHALIQLRP